MVKTSPFHGGNMGSNPVGVTTSWGYSSAGRARALQARGHRFEPCCPHHIKKRATLCVVLFFYVSGNNLRARIRRFLRLCALRAPLCPTGTKYPAGSPYFKKAHQDDVLFLLYGTIYGREPENLFSVCGGCLQTLAKKSHKLLLYLRGDE